MSLKNFNKISNVKASFGLDLRVRGGGLEGAGRINSSTIAFKSQQVSSFKWVQNGTKFDSNGAKLAIFFLKKSQKLSSGRSPSMISVNNPSLLSTRPK